MMEINYYHLKPDQLFKLLVEAYETGCMGIMDLGEAAADDIIARFVEKHPGCLAFRTEQEKTRKWIRPGRDDFIQPSLSISEGEFETPLPEQMFVGDTQITQTYVMAEEPPNVYYPTHPLEQTNVRSESGQDQRGEADGVSDFGGNS